MNRFVFIVPAFNASKTIDQMFRTLCSQSYSDWRVILRDDMSTDDTPQKMKSWQGALGKQRVSFEVNEEKFWEVKNIIAMLKECDGDEIVCRIDADDWLVDNDALAFIDHAYTQTGSLALWTAHRWSFSNHNISGPMPKDADPYVHPWVSSHLKTFRKGVIEGVTDSNFRGETGEYFKRIGDQAIYLPVLKLAAGKWTYLPLVTYHYTIDMSPKTFQSDDAAFQKREAEYLRARGFLS